jgi:hypothetical protein
MTYNHHHVSLRSINNHQCQHYNNDNWARVADVSRALGMFFIVILSSTNDYLQLGYAYGTGTGTQ